MKKRYVLLVAAVGLLSCLMVGCSPAANEAEAGTATETSTPASEIPAVLGEYNYISQEDVVAHIDAGDIESGAMLMVTAQTEEEYAATHMKGKLITNFSRPLETVEDFAKLEASYEIIKGTDVPVIVICPGGKSGATRQCDYFVAKGIDPSRLLILENGQNKFSKKYPDYVESGASATEASAPVVEIPAVLGEYNYISQEDVVAHIDAGDIESGAMLMVTAQTEEEYAATHMKGKLITNFSRPLETVEDFAKLEASYEIIKGTDVPVIVICPGGKSGATRQCDYFVAKGIDPSRLLILENGQNKFSKKYPDYVESGASATEASAPVVEIPAVLGEYNYISQEDVVAHIDAGDIESGAMLMVTAQTEEEYAATHMKGKLISNFSRPLETVEDFAKLEASYEIIKGTDVPVIVICPGGKSGATRQCDYFVAKGIDPSRLLILENGQNKFSKKYPDYVESGAVK